MFERPGHRRFVRMTTPEPTTNLHHASGIWSLVHAERAALAADLADLTDQQWAALSLCTGFTVRQVLAHLTAGASLNPVRWLAGVIRCRFDFDQQVATRLANYYQGSDLVVLAKGRIVGLRLQASDGPFATGSGPLVSGSTLALIMAMAGRVTYCDELDGDGVATLRARCTTP